MDKPSSINTSWLLAMAMLPLLIITSILLFITLFYFLGFSINTIVTIGAIIIGLLLTFILYKIHFSSLRSCLWIYFVWSVILFSLFFLESKLYDYSADGKIYHQEAIIQLSEGWNPVYQPESTTGHAVDIWTHYPKSVWVVSAALYNLSGKIELPKAINAVLAISCFFLVFYVLHHHMGLSVLRTFLMSTLFTLNPIVIAQIHTYYVDGISYSLLLLLISGLILFAYRNGDLISSIIVLSAIFLLNTKFTITVYVIIIIASFAFILLRYRHLALFRKYVVLIITGITINVAFVGFDPYVNNYINHDHPFYPVIGKEDLDLISWQRPDGYNDMRPVQRLFDAHLLTPFSFESDNLKAYFAHYGNYNKNGFGPLFSLFFLFSFLIAVMSVAKIKRHHFQIMIFTIGVLLITVVIHTDSWKARYVPQFWIIPCFVFAYYLLFGSNKLLKKSLMVMIWLVTAFQVVHLGANLIINVRATQRVNEQLVFFGTLKGPIKVYWGQTQSVRKRLEEAGIPYRVVNSSDMLLCDPPGEIYNSRSYFCIE